MHIYNYALIFLDRSIKIGVAIQIEEYVPTTTPTIKAKTNPLIAAPPNKKITKSTTNVVIEVFIVLESVEFNELLICSL